MSSVVQMPAPLTPFVGQVAENVRVECARKDWIQADAARALGVSATTLSARWRGRRQWQLEDLEKLASALEIPVQRFFVEGLPRVDSNHQPSDSVSAVVIDLFTGEQVA